MTLNEPPKLPAGQDARPLTPAGLIKMLLATVVALAVVGYFTGDRTGGKGSVPRESGAVPRNSTTPSVGSAPRPDLPPVFHEYTYTHKVTGQKLTVKRERPPTEAELEELFAQQYPETRTTKGSNEIPSPPPTVPSATPPTPVDIGPERIPPTPPIMALAEAQAAASAGNAEAEFQMGRRYLEGWGVDKSTGEAAKWFQRAADKGHTRAQVRLAKLYYEGKGVKESKAKALALYQNAADKRDGEAQFELGLHFKYRAAKKDKSAALELYLKAASNGDFQAHIVLTEIYEKGEGVPKDEGRAKAFRIRAEARFLDWFRMNLSEAENGNPEAMSLVGAALVASTKQEMAVAVPATPEGSAEFRRAQYLLELLLIAGLVIPEGSAEFRREQGVRWLLRAAETSGDPAILVETGGYYLKGDFGFPQDRIRGDELIREGLAKLRTKAANGDPEAANSLGDIYRWGKNVPKDLGEAEKWYRMAADSGHAASAGSLIAMWAANQLATPPPRAVRDQWERIRAEGASPFDQFIYGLRFYNGDGGTAINHVEAERWFRRAAERDSAHAQNILGWMYGRGEGGLPSDKGKALEWLMKAAESDDFKEGRQDVALMYATSREIPGGEKEALGWWKRTGKSTKDDGTFDECGAFFEIAKELINSPYSFKRDPKQAIRWYKKAVECGSSEAAWELGEKLSRGSDEIAKSVFEAERYLDLGANTVERKRKLAVMYLFGRSVTQSYKKAGALVIECVKLGEKSAVSDLAWHLGIAYADGNGVPASPFEAEIFLDVGVESARQKEELAERYLVGKGVAQNYRKAETLLKQVVAAGSDSAKISLGVVYYNGDAGLRDRPRAYRLWLEVARSGSVALETALAQFNISLCYAEGQGVPKDEVEALAWMNLAAGAGLEDAVKSRNAMEAGLGRQLTLLAQQRSKEIAAGIDAGRKKSPPEGESSQKTPQADASSPKATGSGAFVSPEGHILTAAHVVTGAARITVLTSKGEKPATLLRIDEANDLAVLKLTGGPFFSLPVAPSRAIRLGQSVATIGFPNVGIQGFSPKVTKGEISSLNGIGDDPRAWQVSVPVQPGNSGGPLLDEHGNLVGVVVSKLGAKAAKATGDIPQNVNYAVKSAYALALIEPYLTGDSVPARSDRPRFEDMVAKAQQAVVLILAY